MKSLLSPTQSLILLRIMIAVCMLAHAAQRLILNTVNAFGDFLNAQSLIIGVPLAWAITLFELVGGLLLLVNYFTKWISLIWAFQLLVGIVLVHAQHGWFVVGPSTGGVEYSLVLIVSLLILHAHAKKSTDKA